MRALPNRVARAFLLVLCSTACAIQTGHAQTIVEVVIANYLFEPGEVTIKAGDTVRWTNKEKRTSHSIAFPAEGGLESERLFPDESWQRTFDKPGSYSYTCGPHPEMKGSVVVTE